MWNKQDSNNLAKIATALEILAGKKIFTPSSEQVEIEVESGEKADDEFDKQRQLEYDKRQEIMSKNFGSHLWEETNLAEAEADYENE